jgi:hypothetical protein
MKSLTAGEHVSFGFANRVPVFGVPIIIKFATSVTLLLARYSVYDKESEEPDYDEDELEEEETKEVRSFSKNGFNLNVKQCIPITSSGIRSAKLFLVTKTLYTYTRTCSHCRRISFLYTFNLSLA